MARRAVPRPDVEHAVSGTVQSAQVLPLAVPLSAKARQLAAAGDGPQARAELAELLAAQLGALTATEMGAEVGPGVCTFAGAPPV